MKNTFLIFVSIFFVFTVGIQAKTRIVEKPPYVYSSTTMLEIPRVTLTDTATIVDFDVYYRAGKRLSSVLPSLWSTVTAVVMHSVGVKVWYPESGYVCPRAANYRYRSFSNHYLRKSVRLILLKVPMKTVGEYMEYL